jgi:hypothetical protein
MDIFFAVLSILGIAGLAGIAVLAATELTAKSKFFLPLRKFLMRLSIPTNILRDAKDGTIYGVPSLRHRLFGFLSDLVSCPFCSSCWHAFWILALVGHVVEAPLSWLVVAYLPTIGAAKLAHDMFRKPQPVPNTWSTHTTGGEIQQFLKGPK